MKEQQYIIGITVGYMLKVMKAKKPLGHFKKEFASIRHGNYHEFILSVKAPIPEMVIYNQGTIEVNPESKESDFDFLGLFKAGPSLRKFYEKCVIKYGVFKDNDVSDITFYEVAVFEISLRMHANKYNLLKNKEPLETVIDRIGQHKKMKQNEINTLQNGRHFLNMIKHGSKKIKSWREGKKLFNKAYQLMEDKQLTIM